MKFIQRIPPGLDEVCILAGDIGNPYKEHYDIFMKFISANFMKTFIITGNHEYYHNDIDKVDNHLRHYFMQFNNITLLNNTSSLYNNYYFIGTTLWTNVTQDASDINDTKFIANFDIHSRNKHNALCIDHLKHNISGYKYIIITHHVPSFKLKDERCESSDLDEWFYCDMDDYIIKHKSDIACWIYGHTHTPSSKIMHEVPFLCNPIGYPNENAKINLNKVFILP
jgi:predicted phosphohydrolase